MRCGLRETERERDRDKETVLSGFRGMGCGLNETRVAFALGLSFCFDQSSGEQT